jgi:hypothetical protein
LLTVAAAQTSLLSSARDFPHPTTLQHIDLPPKHPHLITSSPHTSHLTPHTSHLTPHHLSYKRAVAPASLTSRADAATPPSILRLGSRFPYASDAGYPPTPASAAAGVMNDVENDDEDHQQPARQSISSPLAAAAAAAAAALLSSSPLDALSSDEDGDDVSLPYNKLNSSIIPHILPMSHIYRLSLSCYSAANSSGTQ